MEQPVGLGVEEVAGALDDHEAERRPEVTDFHRVLCGTGFDVLLRVVEVASGMPFDQFARQRIFEPLGMKDTSFYPMAGNPRVATLYEQANGSLRKAARVSA